MTKKNPKAVLTIFYACIGGFLAGFVAGGISALIFALSLGLFHTQSASPTDSILFGYFMAFLAGASIGSLAGVASGLSIGIILCYIQHPLMGALAGGIVGLAVSFHLRSGPAALNLAPNEAWLLLFICVSASAIAGYILSCIILRSRRSM